jgi:hypothetical protein
MPKSNTPPPNKRPKPKHYKTWKPEEFLKALEEDQDERRNDQ